MNELKKLTWKYFFQQKWKEINSPLHIVLVFSGFLLLLIGFGFPSEPSLYSIKMIIAAGIILGFFVLEGFYKLIKAFFKWIKDNWQKATERAIHKLSAEELCGGGDLE